MRYTYFPGCTQQSTGFDYGQSARSVMSALDHSLDELPDWSCCGATGADVISDLLSLALPARNLARAQAFSDQIVATCSACYLNLFRVNARLLHQASANHDVNTVLGRVGLEYSGHMRVRHLLEVLATDVGVAAIARRVQRRLGGARIAPYYGCLVVRPYAQFDGPDLPESMDHMLTALGASVVPYMMKTRCCGGVLMMTRQDIGRKLVGDLLAPIKDVDCIVTVCPLCQLNLEAYQSDLVGSARGEQRAPVLYFTQLLGLAFGLPDHDLRLEAGLVGSGRLMAKLREASGWV